MKRVSNEKLVGFIVLKRALTGNASERKWQFIGKLAFPEYFYLFMCLPVHCLPNRKNTIVAFSKQFFFYFENATLSWEYIVSQPTFIFYHIWLSHFVPISPHLTVPLCLILFISLTHDLSLKRSLSLSLFFSHILQVPNVYWVVYPQ